MAAGSSVFDVVIFGTDLEGIAREQAKRKLAELALCDPNQADQLLRTDGAVVKRQATSEEARRLQQQLSQLGIKCNYRPSIATGGTFELVPVEEEEPVIVCPACGHSHRVDPAVPKPEICEKCGVVFSKFEKVSEIKLEREQIKRRLLSQHQRLIDERAAEQKRLDEEARRKLLEEEIRKQLGLPKFVTTRRGIISSAAVIFGLGLFLGSGAVYLTQHEWKGSTKDSGVSAADFSQLDPTILAHIQAQTLLGGGAGMFGQMLAADPAGGADASHAPSKANLLALMLAEINTDAEWDLFLSSRIEGLLSKGEIPVALQLAEHLRNPQLRVARGARLAEYLIKNGKTQEAEKLFNRLTNVAESLSTGEEARVEALCEIARHQESPGTTLATAQLISDHITVPASKAVAEAELGAAKWSLGYVEEARVAFSRANQAVSQIADPPERLLAVARTARSYARSGSRGGAASLLEDVSRGIAALPESHQRNAVLEEVMKSYAELGNVQSALQAADRVSNPVDRDKAIHALVVDELTAGRLTEAMEAADAMKTPAYQARALGFLGRVQHEQPNYQVLATASFERARTLAGAIVNPGERLAVTSELARFASRVPASRLADQFFADAESQSAAILVDAPDHDPALAILTYNQARAFHPADAEKTRAAVRDPALVHALAQDLAEIKEAASLAGH